MNKKGEQQFWKIWETGQEQCLMLEFMKEQGRGLVRGHGGPQRAAQGARSQGKYPRFFAEAERWRSLWKGSPKHSKTKRDDPFWRTAKARIKLLYSALWMCLVLLAGYNLMGLAMLCVCVYIYIKTCKIWENLQWQNPGDRNREYFSITGLFKFWRGSYTFINLMPYVFVFLTKYVTTLARY